MKFFQIVAVLALLVAKLTAQVISTPPPIYGTGWQAFANGLENFRLGPDGPKVAIRFRAEQTGLIRNAILFVKTGNDYSAGTGGLVKVSLQTDDGTANHFPSGIELDSSQTAPGNPASPPFHHFPFSGSAGLTAGTLYHLVISNLDPQPELNYVSLNSLGNESFTASPYYSALDWGMSRLVGTAWRAKWNVAPIAAITYVNGYKQGQGYIDALGQSGLYTIQGNNRVREIFTVSGADKVVYAVRVHILKVGSPGDLTIRLKTGDGTVLEEGTVPASAIRSLDYNWATYNFASSHTLSGGLTYSVALFAPPDPQNNYQVFPLEKGDSVGLAVSSEFHDGNYQINNGAGWQNLEGSDGFDLQLYLSTEPYTPMPSMTLVTSSGSPSQTNQVVTFTAAVTSNGGPVPDGEPVSFKDPSTGAVLASIPLSRGLASYSTTILHPGTYTVKAKYGGDTNFAASSAIVTQVVTH